MKVKKQNSYSGNRYVVETRHGCGFVVHDQKERVDMDVAYKPFINGDPAKAKAAAQKEADRLNSNEQSIRLVMESSGDPAVGIPRLFEEVTVTFRHGGHGQDMLEDFKDEMVKLLTNFFCDGSGGVEDADAYAARVANEKGGNDL